jgi:hypothetical protein
MPVQESPSYYRSLLEGVVALARRTTLPNLDENISTMFESLSVEDDPFDRQYQAYFSKDWGYRKRVGAAGELFVRSLHSNYFTPDC